jgi:hypothetical protein
MTSRWFGKLALTLTVVAGLWTASSPHRCWRKRWRRGYRGYRRRSWDVRRSWNRGLRDERERRECRNSRHRLLLR